VKGGETATIPLNIQGLLEEKAIVEEATFPIFPFSLSEELLKEENAKVVSTPQDLLFDMLSSSLESLYTPVENEGEFKALDGALCFAKMLDNTHLILAFLTPPPLDDANAELTVKYFFIAQSRVGLAFTTEM